MIPPLMVKMPPPTYTPPPEPALLPVIVPPYMVNVPPDILTPPPEYWLVLPVIIPPYILKVPVEPTHTPAPFTPELLVMVPLSPDSSYRFKVVPFPTMITGFPSPPECVMECPFRQRLVVPEGTLQLPLIVTSAVR